MANPSLYEEHVEDRVLHPWDAAHFVNMDNKRSDQLGAGTRPRSFDAG